jgi:hypothetical protein
MVIRLALAPVNAIYQDTWAQKTQQKAMTILSVNCQGGIYLTDGTNCCGFGYFVVL